MPHKQVKVQNAVLWRSRMRWVTCVPGPEEYRVCAIINVNKLFAYEWQLEKLLIKGRIAEYDHVIKCSLLESAPREETLEGCIKSAWSSAWSRWTAVLLWIIQSNDLAFRNLDFSLHQKKLHKQVFSWNTAKPSNSFQDISSRIIGEL